MEIKPVTIDSRVPIDKTAIIKEFSKLPEVTQISLLVGVAAGLATRQSVDNNTAEKK